MFCSKCGANLAPAAAFCPGCGTPVQATTTASARPVESAQPMYSAAPVTAGMAGAAPVSPHWLPTPTRTYAGFWLRFVALIVDSLIISIVSSVLFFPLMGITGLGAALRGIRPDHQPDSAFFVALFSALPLLIGVGVAVRWLYYAYCESSEWQATLGKKALNLVVTDLEGNRISFGRASGRFFAKYVSMLTLCIGFILAGFTEKKQALHDMMAGCLVLRS